MKDSDAITSSYAALKAARDAVATLENVTGADIRACIGSGYRYSRLCLVIELSDGCSIEVATAEDLGGTEGDLELSWAEYDGEGAGFILYDHDDPSVLPPTTCSPYDLSDLIRYVRLSD